MRIKEPFFTGSTRNQQSIIGGQQQVASSAQLPPPPGTSGPINLAGGAPAPAYGGGYNTGGGTVVVAQGETLEIIAMRYGVPVQSLAQANGITSAAQVVPGRALVIPQAGGAPVAYASADSLPTPAPVAVPVAASASGGVIHVVEPGQTLFGIAQAQGVSMQDIMAANGMTSQTVRIGQRLKIPSAGGGATVQTASLN
ncbi:MAG: LysM peptidoglycan-binding domain-containing protein, partial [Rhizobiales bacterium]|nr:LysM peptidoglycan-binding domain-containing protein [Hyphomicrobiales bacterium]